MSKPGMPPIIGVIGGSGLYEIEGLEDGVWQAVTTPFGDPSDSLMTGSIDGQKVVFLPRHGRGHPIPPSELNFRANIAALKKLGVTEIISLSAVGSLREDLAPGTFVIVDQFIDQTFSRTKSFFGTGLVAHVTMADPVCRRLGDVIEAAAANLGISAIRGGTYLVMEGPQFSTRAESELYRGWGCDVIGMTNMPEAKLARESEMCYATVAMVTDFDCWHPHHEDVNVHAIIKVLTENAERARDLIKRMMPVLAKRPDPCKAGCHTALEGAVITAPDARDPALVNKLGIIAGRVL